MNRIYTTESILQTLTKNLDDPYFKTFRCPTKKIKVLTQWYSMNLGLTHIYKTESIFQTLTTKPWCTCFQNLEMTHQRMQGVKPMRLCAPYSYSYLHNWINTPNLNHQTFIFLLLLTVMCLLKQCKILMKWTFPNDVYKPKYMGFLLLIFPDETNVNNNQHD